MRLPTKARSIFSLLAVLTGSALLGACAGDATDPLRSPEALTPAGASQAIAVHSSNGVYTFTIDAAKSNALWMGQHKLSIPANGICDLGSSGYGSAYWNTPCTPHSGTMTITAVVTTSLDGHPQIDFSPALRFNPATNVSLYMWDAKASAGTARKLSILYCPILSALGDAAGCINEASVDSDLQTQFVAGTYYLYRRIKHFSGYVIINATDESTMGAF
jgi:hypothetical protein